ncbi:MAG: ARMT1-like domain-containing protein [Planctomycetes bacterium]|nr:ARMT1-like domain-containing protein [Planctomycetota bacterium]
MKPIPDCVPDALTMILAAARAVSDENFIHCKVLLKVMAEIAEEGNLGSSPADIYLECWETACRALGVKDPFENEKARSGKAALGLLRYLDGNISAGGEDALRQAIRMSLAGTMLNFSGLGRSDMQEETLKYFRTAPARDESDALIAAIDKAGSVMLVANRAGEIVMDRPLAEAMADRGKKVYLAVAEKPVFLMATQKDAAISEFSGRIMVVDPGTSMYGLMPERASSEFRDLLAEVDLVIVKGGVHFSTMSPQRDAFFILKGNVEAVAARLEIPLGAGAVVRITPTKE